MSKDRAEDDNEGLGGGSDDFVPFDHFAKDIASHFLLAYLLTLVLLSPASAQNFCLELLLFVLMLLDEVPDIVFGGINVPPSPPKKIVKQTAASPPPCAGDVDETKASPPQDTKPVEQTTAAVHEKKTDQDAAEHAYLVQVRRSPSHT